MNRSVLLLIIAAVAVIVVMQRDGRDDTPEQPASPAPSGGLHTFHDITGGYRIQYPAHWKLDDHTRADRLIRADISTGKVAGVQIRIEKGIAVDFPRYVDTYIERFKSDMTGHWGGDVTETDRRFEAIGAHEGCRISLILKRGDGQEWFFKEYLWPRGDWVYIIQAGTELDSRRENEPILDAMAASFELVSGIEKR
jgi:hypothetical protein